jgi:hypothetical protein
MGGGKMQENNGAGGSENSNFKIQISKELQNATLKAAIGAG